MLPRLVLRMRKAVRRMKARNADDVGLSGDETQARWHAMLDEIDAKSREVERRLAEAERALNRLSGR